MIARTTPFQFALPNWSYGRPDFQVLSAKHRLPSDKTLAVIMGLLLYCARECDERMRYAKNGLSGDAWFYRFGLILA
jgi:hypothetical protein